MRMEGHKTIVEILLAKGADVNAGDVGGGTPLDGAESLQRRDDLLSRTQRNRRPTRQTRSQDG